MANGYALGVHAPGRTLMFDALPAIHHQLLAHGLGAQALRAAGVKGDVGVTNLHSPVRPASGKVGDKLVAKLYDLLMNRIYADPVLLGRYPHLPLYARPWLRSIGQISEADLNAFLSTDPALREQAARVLGNKGFALANQGRS